MRDHFSYLHNLLFYCIIKHNDNCYHNRNSVSKIYKWYRVIFVAHLFVSNVNSAVLLYKQCK